jgi:hypothetical protein
MANPAALSPLDQPANADRSSSPAAAAVAAAAAVSAAVCSSCGHRRAHDAALMAGQVPDYLAHSADGSKRVSVDMDCGIGHAYQGQG